VLPLWEKQNFAKFQKISEKYFCKNKIQQKTRLERTVFFPLFFTFFKNIFKIFLNKF